MNNLFKICLSEPVPLLLANMIDYRCFVQNVRLYHLNLHQVTSSVKEMWLEGNVQTSLVAGPLEVFA